MSERILSLESEERNKVLEALSRLPSRALGNQVVDTSMRFHALSGCVMGEDIDRILDENTDLLARVLAHGDSQARSYVLALYANADSTEPVDRVIELLEEIRESKAEGGKAS